MSWGSSLFRHVRSVEAFAIAAYASEFLFIFSIYVLD